MITEEQINELAEEYIKTQQGFILDKRAGFKAGMKKAIELMQPEIDLSTTGDIICHQCHNSNPAWYASNDLFNEINESPNGVLCPLCFQKKADEKGINIIFTVELITKTD